MYLTTPHFSRVPNTRQNPDLKPERTKSFEAGLNMEFLKRRVGLMLPLQKSKQLMGLFLSLCHGQRDIHAYYVNAAEIKNKGVELQLYGSPVKQKISRGISM